MAATQERKLTVKEEKRLAKEQDRNYVDYRKQEILHLIKPKTKAFNLKKFDDEFPRPKKKDKINMKFGEEMHMYLTLRPDARFATWPGKPANKKKKPKAAAPVKSGLMAKMATAAGVAKPQKEATPEPAKKPVVKNYTKAVAKILIQKAEFDDDEIDHKRLKEAELFIDKKDIEEKNKYALNAIVEGKPFWLIGEPVVPDEEEDAYVDADLLNSWTAKTEAVRAKFFHNNAERARFFPFGPTAQLMTGPMVVFGNKCLVIGNTLQSIIESTADRKGLCKERVDKGHKPMVKWSKKTHTIEYVMDSVPLEKTAICEGKFQLILKENAKKE
ncbi:unnamed protein product [Caenorhabditis nigoni]|uniref:Uncharacterized protein n=2 Tax=Caenorhabditis nigoni TaxID=1611254 RepID=A0A2G5VTY2_9PELO|nr:hypothetical protein B9Z55_000547 [Caenorhabditis nigoni]